MKKDDFIEIENYKFTDNDESREFASANKDEEERTL